MRFTLATVFALVSSALAQTDGFDVFSKPASGESVPAGKTYEVTWTYNSAFPGTVKLELLGGATQSTQQILSTIATGVDSTKGSYSWAVDSSLGQLAVYGIKLSLESAPATFQYSFPFKIAGSSGASSSASGSATGSASGSVTATVTLSSVSQTSTTAASTTSSASTNGSSSSITKIVTSSTAASNLSTTASTKTTIATVVTSAGSGTTSSSTPSATAVTKSGASTVAFSSFAALAGLALAVFTL